MRRLDGAHEHGAGIAGNERADEIAVQFSKNQLPTLYSGPLKGYSIPILEIPSPQEMERLMHRAIDSDDLESLIYGCYLALESDVPSAETWVRDAEHRLSSGQQKMRPHPFATQQGRSTEEEALYAIHLLLAELSERQRDPAG